MSVPRGMSSACLRHICLITLICFNSTETCIPLSVGLLTLIGPTAFRAPAVRAAQSTSPVILSKVWNGVKFCRSKHTPSCIAAMMSIFLVFDLSCHFSAAPGPPHVRLRTR
ncbi:hypothetical protein DFH07DRAFT_547713 [Mycena maculata]|uniref:Secreted protein n=1 Tax=Mycena maculata TaxID=230809 RepID=A0AAD7N8Q3_9AGAR|nr:hypothetical protein DFH07DRAFT_547713 [Mycena maculata]